ncbi:protein FAM216A [Odontesthes bonariensis]
MSHLAMRKQVTFAENQMVHILHHDEALPRHAALTPAQREYLYTIAASYSTAHVRSLISQHYMNVLHRSIQAGED